MRALTLAAGLLTLGALAMSDQAATADGKKSPSDPKSYTEKVTVKKWYGGKFLNPVKDVPAFRGEIKGKAVMYIMPPAGNAQTPAGSEITAADGTVYVVDKTVEFKSSGYQIDYITPKKP